MCPRNRACLWLRIKRVCFEIIWYCFCSLKFHLSHFIKYMLNYHKLLSNSSLYKKVHIWWKYMMKCNEMFEQIFCFWYYDDHGYNFKNMKENRKKKKAKLAFLIYWNVNNNWYGEINYYDLKLSSQHGYPDSHEVSPVEPSARPSIELTNI